MAPSVAPKDSKRAIGNDGGNDLQAQYRRPVLVERAFVPKTTVKTKRKTSGQGRGGFDHIKAIRC
eukprot:UN03685